MLYKFRILSDEVKEFIRDVEILSGQTFYEFHQILTCNFHYDNSQLASFFVSNENWEKLDEITLFDMSEGDGKANIHVMDQTKLNEFIAEPGQRLLYVFDFFNERLLFIELIAVTDKVKRVVYPKITLSNGNPPLQLLPDNSINEDLDLDEE